MDIDLRAGGNRGTGLDVRSGVHCMADAGGGGVYEFYVVRVGDDFGFWGDSLGFAANKLAFFNLNE